MTLFTQDVNQKTINERVFCLLTPGNRRSRRGCRWWSVGGNFLGGKAGGGVPGGNVV
eukprot:CAMPEP_0176138662 /NCGR_PEP_ID=MMETSP0120_2-20121206/70438_1 /TAXON_ID=160619 /ORGANISM="Kryptoperidinium foliaceum, Strain CCMP 1326" /LENGTH=56 /DNA_ID=CAMNT_0017474609 /DNA_START=84 /DNA_END=251 /DNA_ORIENTATION=+